MARTGGPTTPAAYPAPAPIRTVPTAAPGYSRADNQPWSLRSERSELTGRLGRGLVDAVALQKIELGGQKVARSRLVPGRFGHGRLAGGQALERLRFLVLQLEINIEA
jgi:hypothetical protein